MPSAGSCHGLGWLPRHEGCSIILWWHDRHMVAQIMTRIGGVCLVTIGIWVIIELSVQFGEPSKGRLFGHHGHTCGIGVGAGTGRQKNVLHKEDLPGKTFLTCTVVVLCPLGRSPVKVPPNSAGLRVSKVPLPVHARDGTGARSGF